MIDTLTGLAILAADEQQQQLDPTMRFLVQIMPWVGIAFLFYFILIRPQKREQQRKDSMLNALKKNDRVVTIGGIIGSVVTVDGREVTLKVDDNTRIKVLRSSIQDLLNREDEQDASARKA